jgi:5S rRNA maturation endonuclease (ribonuclease M5)
MAINYKNDPEDRQYIDFDKARELANAYSDKILADLGLETDVYGDVKCGCPVHGGDNHRGFSWDDKRKTWLCFTQKCHDKHTKTILGLIKAIKDCSWKEVTEYIEEITGEKVGHITQEQLDLHNYVRKNKKRPQAKEIKLDRSMLARIPSDSKYFLTRGLSQEAIEKWQCFDCHTAGKTLQGRACLPIIDHKNNLLGFAGRSINKMEPKWLTYPLQNQFKNTFFGINFALEEIERTRKVILVEGFLDAVIMQEYGYANCVSMFGTALTEDQRNLLLSLGVTDIILMLDPDMAGVQAARKITKDLGIYFSVTNLTESLFKEPSEMTSDEVKELFQH